jgi:hypothetical protein
MNPCDTTKIVSIVTVELPHAISKSGWLVGVELPFTATKSGSVGV